MNNESSLLLEKKMPEGFFLVYDNKPSFPFHFAQQVHGTDIHLLLDVREYIENKNADGIMLIDDENEQEKNNPIIAVKTADCLPIAVLGKKGKAIIHAGWKGIREKILLQKKIEALIPYYFFIGPHIQSSCYEVQKEFRNEFPKSLFFTEKEGKLYFSLKNEICSQIQQNYSKAQVEYSEICTHCNENFHSFRRNGTNLRNWNILLT